MASKRCGCASESCSCVISGGLGIEVSGSGSRTNPYVVDATFAAAHYTTALRPLAPSAGVGAQIYDTDLGLPLWSDGTVWRNAAGAAV